MTALHAALSAFVAADVEGFAGLPLALRLDDLVATLAFDRGDRRTGEAGTPVQHRLWVPAESGTYFEGIRLWLDDDDERVLLLEGLSPVDAAGEPVLAPDLGVPDAVFDAVLGPFRVPDSERVYAERGLAIRVAAGTGALFGVLAFAPTTVEDYQARLQPHHEPLRPFVEGVTP